QRSRISTYDGAAVDLKRRVLHRFLLLDQGTHSARSAAEDVTRAGSVGSVHEPGLGGAVSGDLVLLQRNSSTRQCHAALLPICCRERKPLCMVQRLWTSSTAAGRSPVDGGV